MKPLGDDDKRTGKTIEVTDTSEVEARTQEDGEPILVLISHPAHKSLGRRYPLPAGGVVEVGRSRDCELDFPEVPSLSRVHARIHVTVDGIYVEDLESTNGSFVNQRRVNHRFALTAGDRLQFGGVHFKFLRDRDVETAYYEMLYRLAMEDGLTEASNKRRFDEELNREFARAHRYSRRLTLILFDLDHFKKVNDDYGHLCGDYVLQQVARLTQSHIRQESLFARLGGDEFAIVGPEVGAQGGSTFAEKLRVLIAESDFAPDFVKGQLRITCSFGVAEFNPRMESSEDLYAAADECLYESKNEGRDRVTVRS